MDSRNKIMSAITKKNRNNVILMVVLFVLLVGGLVMAEQYGVAAVMAIILGIFMLLDNRPAKKMAKKCMERLERRGAVDVAAYELSSPNQRIFMNDKLIITDHFVFGRNTGVVMACDEIIWAYQHRQTTRYMLIPISVVDSLYIAGKNMPPCVAATIRKDKNQQIYNAMCEIHRRNPYCLFGYTDENERQYNRMCSMR